MKAFSAMATSAGAPGALDAKTKELIALAISVAVRCDDCIAFHAKAAAQRGATREEVMETLGMSDLHGRWPVRDVCEPCARRLHAIRRRQKLRRRRKEAIMSLASILSKLGGGESADHRT